MALHATDPASVFLAARARLADPSTATIEDALYEQRTLVRMLGMRRTMFVVPTELAAVVQASSTRALLAGERKRFVALLESSGVASDGARWLDETQAATLRALAARGEATAAELGKDVPALRAKTAVAMDKPYGAIQRVSTKVLFLLAAEGKSCAAGRSARGRARSTAGRRSRPGCRARSRSSRPTPRRPSSCAAGSWRSGRARWPT